MDFEITALGNENQRNRNNYCTLILMLWMRSRAARQFSKVVRSSVESGPLAPGPAAAAAAAVRAPLPAGSLPVHSSSSKSPSCGPWGYSLGSNGTFF